MSRTAMLISMAAAAVLAGGVAPSQPRRAPRADAAAIASAMSAAPAAVGRRATIVAMGPGGAMRILRRGSNGFTCMADNPRSPGRDPICADEQAMAWMMALARRRPPPADTVGLMYMLAGGSDASNVDAHAGRPRPGEPWVRTGPHVMIVGSEALLRGYPSGPRPDTARPYVMWAGTPYAHLMVPVR